jgi:PLP dependent protein
MTIAQNLNFVLHEMEKGPHKVSLVVVSKNATIDDIIEAYGAGCRHFGESRVQVALEKIEKLHNRYPDIQWHFIGKLQKNKVAKVIGHFVLIHSVDSVELAQKISDLSIKRGCVTPILLEVNVSGEKTKEGLSCEEWEAHFLKLLDMPGIKIEGLMTMAPLTQDEKIIRDTFKKLPFFLARLQQIGGNKVQLKTLSMGMSNDFRIAIQEGSNLVRIGSLIFNR